MTADRFHFAGRIAARAAAVLAGLYLAFAVGAPWILNDAPPSVQTAASRPNSPRAKARPRPPGGSRATGSSCKCDG